MMSVLRPAAALALALLAAGCATGELSGSRTGSAAAAPSVPLTRVEVVLVDDPKLKAGGLSAILPPRVGENRPALMSAAGSGVHTVMVEASVGAEEALAQAGIPAHVRLSSRQPGPTVGPPPSHLVLVTMDSATAYSAGYAKVTLQVQVYEAAERRLLWTGTAAMYDSSSRRPAERDEVDAAFGRGVVEALRQSGAWTAVAGATAPLPGPPRPQVQGVPVHIGDTVPQVLAALHTDRPLTPAPKLLLGPTLNLADQGISVSFGHDERVQSIRVSPPYPGSLGAVTLGPMSMPKLGALHALGEPLYVAMSPFGNWIWSRTWRLAGHGRARLEFDKDGSVVALVVTG